MTDIQEEIDKLREQAQKESPKALEYLEKLHEIEITKLEGYAKRNWEAIKKLTRATVIILSVLVVGLFVLGLVGINLSSETKSLQQNNSQRIKEINESRQFAIKTQCEEQDEKHKAAKVGLEELVKKVQTNKKLSIDELKEQKFVLRAFVEAIVPEYNCKERLEKFTEKP